MNALLVEEEAAIRKYDETGDGADLQCVQSKIWNMVNSGKGFEAIAEFKADRHISFVNNKRARAKMAKSYERNDRKMAKSQQRLQPTSRNLWTAITRGVKFEDALDDEATDGVMADVEDLEAWDDMHDEAPPTGKIIKSVDLILKPHQVEGVSFLWERAEQKLGGLLAFAMGLGKTLTTLAFLDKIYLARDKKVRAVIVCPTIVTSEWFKEYHNFSEALNITMMPPIVSCDDFVARKARWNTRGGIIVMSMDMLVALKKKKIVSFNEMARATEVVVVDEMHAIKNIETHRSRAVAAFVTPLKIGLTGTPLANSPMDYYNIMRIVDPGILNDMSTPDFKRIFSTPIERAQFYDATEEHRRQGRNQTSVLRTLFQSAILHKSSTILRDVLPKKTEFIVVYDIPDEVRSRIDVHMTDEGASYLQAQSILDREARKVKVACVRNMLNVLNHGDAAIVFSTHPQTLRDVAACFPEQAVVLEGSTSQHDRTNIIENFAQGMYDILCLSTGAGATGINCQRANKVIIMDPRENPADDSQAVHRAWRLGQRRPVEVYRCAAKDTVDMRILQRGAVKLSMAHSVLNPEHVNTHLKKSEAHGDETTQAIHFAEPKMCKDKLLSLQQGTEIVSWALYDAFFQESENDATDAINAKNDYHKRLNDIKHQIVDLDGQTVQVKATDVLLRCRDDRIMLLKMPIPIVDCRLNRTNIDLVVDRKLESRLTFQICLANTDDLSTWSEPSVQFSQRKFSKRLDRSDVRFGMGELVCRSRAVYDGKQFGEWSEPSAPFALREATV